MQFALPQECGLISDPIVASQLIEHLPHEESQK
jgi:hypothetical protein